MFGSKRVPVLRIDRLPERRSPIAFGGVEPESVMYSFSVDPEVRRPLETWDQFRDIVHSIGTGKERTNVRFEWSGKSSTCAAEIQGAARLDRLLMRWEDSALVAKVTPKPWYATQAEKTGQPGRVPIGDVPLDLDSLSEDQIVGLSDLDFATVAKVAVLTEAEVLAGLEAFIAAGGAKASGILEMGTR